MPVVPSDHFDSINPEVIERFRDTGDGFSTIGNSSTYKQSSFGEETVIGVVISCAVAVILVVGVTIFWMLR